MFFRFTRNSFIILYFKSHFKIRYHNVTQSFKREMLYDKCMCHNLKKKNFLNSYTWESVCDSSIKPAFEISNSVTFDIQIIFYK